MILGWIRGEFGMFVGLPSWDCFAMVLSLFLVLSLNGCGMVLGWPWDCCCGVV